MMMSTCVTFATGHEDRLGLAFALSYNPGGHPAKIGKYSTL